MLFSYVKAVWCIKTYCFSHRARTRTLTFEGGGVDFFQKNHGNSDLRNVVFGPRRRRPCLLRSCPGLVSQGRTGEGLCGCHVWQSFVHVWQSFVSVPVPVSLTCQGLSVPLSVTVSAPCPNVATHVHASMQAHAHLTPSHPPFPLPRSCQARGVQHWRIVRRTFA